MSVQIEGKLFNLFMKLFKSVGSVIIYRVVGSCLGTIDIVGHTETHRINNSNEEPTQVQNQEVTLYSSYKW